MNQEFRKNLHFPSYRVKYDSIPHKPMGMADLRGGVVLRSDRSELQVLLDQFKAFFRRSSIRTNGGYPIILEIVRCDKGRGAGRIIVRQDECRIQGVDSDELRRGVYLLEKIMLESNELYLKTGTFEFSGFLQYRIGRSVLSPTKRPPNSVDELLEKTECYPEAYLNQLAHEGVNGIWLTITWKELAETSFYPVDPGRMKRIDRLREIVARCAGYGIKVFIFCIEPYNFEANDPVLLRHPEFRGASYYHHLAFCPSTDKGRKYIYDSVYSIFRDVPGLGGMINISLGERGTTCLSTVSALADDVAVACPNCAELKPAAILGKCMQAIYDGMQAAAPEAEFISWLYLPFPAAHRAQWVYDIAAHTPKGVILLYNFESGGTPRQGGRVRPAGDYWLAYPGPSDSFRKMAKAARRNGIRIGAKIQVGGSLETETVSGVPVPGILYRKYRSMKRLGVTIAVQSWLFGAKTGVMTRAAGLLNSFDFSLGEEEFLRQLALPEWREKSTLVARAWRYFSAGYRHFPICYMFQYYSPSADGVAWPLHLKMRLRPLTPVWKLDFPVSGDAIGECLQNHTIEEALWQMRLLCRNWKKGMDILRKVGSSEIEPERLREIAAAEAVGIQFASTANILEFYLLRSRLFDDPGNLKKMERIVRREMAGRTRMLELLKVDGTLGYQAEAEGYKYNARKIRRSIACLQRLLDKDFPAAVRNPRFPARRHPKYGLNGETVLSRTFHWRMEEISGDDYCFTLDIDRESADATFHIALFPASGIRRPRLAAFSRGGVKLDQIGLKNFRLADTRIEFSIPRTALTEDVPMLFSVYRVENAIEDFAACENSPPARAGYIPRLRLNLGYFNPESMFELAGRRETAQTAGKSAEGYKFL